MGIPAYYSYLVKNYKKIIIKLDKLNKNVHNFYLDSNSIIYNCLAEMDGFYSKSFMNELIKNICLQIDIYIKEVKPTKLVYISFDGIAPVAKLKQQKERRFKSKIIEELINDIIEENTMEKCKTQLDKEDKFDRTSITPGTYFMNNLNKKVKEYFRGRGKAYNVKKIIVSGSDERGEGEHKIFDYIRNNKDVSESHIIYGLDADLIILCLNHMYITKKIFLFRETPEFIRNLSPDMDPGDLYIMNIEELMYYILGKMFGKDMRNDKINVKCIKDYVFIMQFLGNDFMPHFPSLNIRTHGIEMLLETYKNILGKKKMYIMDNGTIIWKHVRELVEEFANMELDNLKREYKIRDKMAMSVIRRELYEPEDKEFTKEVLEKSILNIPIKDRELEKEIDPNSYYWENRYYEKLFNTERNEANLKKICVNYIQGLEWNIVYYTEGCKDWKWKYNYCYPPLFRDLLKYIPLWDIEFIKENNHSISAVTQLAYVLPPSSLYLMPKQYQMTMIKYKHKKNDVALTWAFCRYFWEAHFEFQLEKLDEIEEIIEDIDKNTLQPQNLKVGGNVLLF
jgi:5'-3' exoribonuclease 1